MRDAVERRTGASIPDWATETADRLVRQSTGGTAGQLRERIAQALRSAGLGPYSCDEPLFDATDGACPAWWRAHDEAADWRARAERAEAQVARVRVLVADLDAQDQAEPEGLLDVRVYEAVDALRHALGER